MFICIYHSIYTILFGWWTVNYLRAHRDTTALYETLLRCYGDLTAIALRSNQDGVPTAFVLTMHNVHAVTRRSMRSHRVHWRCHCVAAALLAFPSCAGWRSGLFRTPWERRPSGWIYKDSVHDANYVHIHCEISHILLWRE